MLNRLCLAALDSLQSDVHRPVYDRSRVTPGVVHIGVGNFHRAHQAVYFDNLLGLNDLTCGIIGVSLRRPDMAGLLNPQDGLYTEWTSDQNGDHFRIIGALGKVITAPAAPDDVLQALCAPGIAIVTITVSEKGYLLDRHNGRLDMAHPIVRQDLEMGSWVGLPGLLVSALQARRAARMVPFTVVSCDNLPANGDMLRQAVIDFAAARDADLASWITDQVDFPNSMVDRIVPATTSTMCDDIKRRYDGISDPGMVKAEPFSQWVIEDRFRHGRPDLGSVGVQLVSHVAPFETAKLRLLNGAHSMLAYGGTLLGYELIDQALGDENLNRLVRLLMHEDILPSLDDLPGQSHAAYSEEILSRFANSEITYRCLQVAMDGSQKLPQRWLAGICWNLEQGRLPRYLGFALACWMAYLMGCASGSSPETLNDPLNDPLADQLLAAIGEAKAVPSDVVDGLFAMTSIFPSQITDNQPFGDLVKQYLRAIDERGCKDALTQALAPHDRQSG